MLEDCLCQYLLAGLLLKRRKLAGLLNFGLEIDGAMVNLGLCSAVVGLGIGEIMIVDCQNCRNVTVKLSCKVRFPMKVYNLASLDLHHR